MKIIQLCLRRIARALARFGRARAGNVAITFAFTLIPLLAMVGAAVDFSRANAIKASLQAALDSTALMSSKNAASLTAGQIQTNAQSYFAALFTRPEAKNVTITASYSTDGGSSVVVGGTADMDTTFMAIVGFKKITVAGTSTAKWGSARLRVALVLDTTGSMADDGKITALKSATKDLITQLKSAASTNGDVYVSIIPFSRSVNVGAGNYSASWIDWSEWDSAPAYMATWLSNSTNKSIWDQAGPGDPCPFSSSQTGFGCVNSPVDGASSTNTIPSGGTYAGYICPGVDSGGKDGTKGGFDYPGCYKSTTYSSTGSTATCTGHSNCSCSGSGSNRTCKTNNGYFEHAWTANAHSTWTGCVADRGSTTAPGTNAGNDQTVTAPSTGNTTTLYPARQDTYCPTAALGLSYNWTAMNSAVDALNPNGGTNQPIGLVMGWHSLAGIGPFTAPSKNSNYTYNEVIILLSDGLNTWDRWYGTGSSVNTSVDNRMYSSSNGAGTCANIKNAGVTLYTIQVNTGGDPTSALLQNCAGGPDKFSDPSKFYMVTAASGLGTVFNAIGTNLTQLRVAK